MLVSILDMEVCTFILFNFYGSSTYLYAAVTN